MGIWSPDSSALARRGSFSPVQERRTGRDGAANGQRYDVRYSHSGHGDDAAECVERYHVEQEVGGIIVGESRGDQGPVALAVDVCP